MTPAQIQQVVAAVTNQADKSFDHVLAEIAKDTAAATISSRIVQR